MSLRDELKPLTGNKRKFLLLRIVDMDVNTALTLCGVKRGTYNSWCQIDKFVTLYRQRDRFAGEFKQEAIQLLRRDNQLAAVLLESEILSKLKEEIESGELSLTRTNLAREVYSRLMGDLDSQPKVQNLTWAQRIEKLVMPDRPQIEGEETIEGEFTEASVEDTGIQGQEQP